ncbi:MAG: Rieske 2Fe-2S domain-containing protein [Bacteroidota bacterium]
MNEFQGFTKVCKYSNLKEKIGQRFIVNEIDVAVFKVDGKVYALSNMCLHQKAFIIYDGFVDDGKVTCPAHGWQYDLKTGIVAGGIKGLDVYEVKIHNDDVFVKVFEKKLNW